jgi:ubiquinone/menaquinone biosynthesis C-methylase UbiE
MSTQLDTSAEQYRALMREEWTDDRTIQAWRRWHPKILAQLEEMTEAIVQTARLRPGMQVLDLACGTGDPALVLARLVVPGGHVIATDLSDGMLETAAENARREGLGTISFARADAEDLPFDDARFDVVTSRIGAMYFVDIQRALGEILRVLRPGGRVVLTAWGPLEHNVYAATLLTPFFKRVEVPPPPAGAPQPLRFAQAGSLSAELRDAGFAQVQEEARVIASRWPGPPEELWQHFYEIAAPFVPIFDGLPPAERSAAIGEVIDGFRRYYDGDRVNMPTSIVIATGTRPEGQ